MRVSHLRKRLYLYPLHLIHNWESPRCDDDNLVGFRPFVRKLLALVIPDDNALEFCIQQSGTRTTTEDSTNDTGQNIRAQLTNSPRMSPQASTLQINDQRVTYRRRCRRWRWHRCTLCALNFPSRRRRTGRAWKFDLLWSYTRYSHT